MNAILGLTRLTRLTRLVRSTRLTRSLGAWLATQAGWAVRASSLNRVSVQLKLLLERLNRWPARPNPRPGWLNRVPRLSARAPGWWLTQPGGWPNRIPLRPGGSHPISPWLRRVPRLPGRLPPRLPGRPLGRLPERGDERGDVPGWVMVTLMTAGLVITLWAVAGPRLSEVFSEAMDRVVGGP